MASNVGRIIEAHERRKGLRHNWESLWREVLLLVRPDREESRHKSRGGESSRASIYDGTPEHYLELLASALSSMLTNPSLQWFNLRTSDRSLDNKQHIKKYLQEVVTKIHDILNATNFHQEMHCLYMDQGSVGTAALFMAGDDEHVIRFDCRNLMEVWMQQNHKNIIDTIDTLYDYTGEELLDKYGEKSFDEQTLRKIKRKLNQTFEVLHTVMPRKSAKLLSLSPKRFPIASYHILLSEKKMIKESGFHEMPWATPRWIRHTGETYGRSPCMKALPDIRMLNMMMRDTIRSAQKATDPPLLVPDDSFFGAPNTAPGGLTYYRSGSPDKIVSLEHKGQVRLALEMIEDVRNRIKSALFIDRLQLREGPQMTATEVDRRTDDDFRLFGPVLGRQHFELLPAVIKRVMGEMKRRDLMPPNPPAELEGIGFEVFYISEIAKAQRIAEGTNLDFVINSLGPLMEAKPEMLDRLNGDEIVKFKFDIHNLPALILNSDEDTEVIRENRAQKEEEAFAREQENQQADTDNKSAQAIKAVGG